METSFWLERWRQRQIGFHQQAINPYLLKCWPLLGVAADVPVFVPLCGKSRDMQWLRSQGHRVLGIELARIAIEEFFREQQIEPVVSRDARFEYFDAPGYRLICGDFFALEPADLCGVRAVFDRAALVALPAEMRQRYATKLTSVLSPQPSSVSMLLIAMTYVQAQMNGPPFSVDEAEVRRLYATWSIEKLHDENILEHPDNARFKDRGVTVLSEQAYRLNRQ